MADMINCNMTLWALPDNPENKRLRDEILGSSIYLTILPTNEKYFRYILNPFSESERTFPSQPN